jgi:HlyD family secretion protein
VVAFHAVRQPLTQTLLVTGHIAQPARTDLGAMMQSTVVQVLVDEGDDVEVGALLVQLADNDARARLDEARAQVDEAAARLARVRGVGRDVAEQQVLQARIASEEAEKVFRREKSLFDAGATSEAIFDDALKGRDTARSQLVAAQLEAAATGQAGADTAAAAASLARAQAAFSIAETALARTQLRAPSAGRILQRLVEVGQVVRPGDPLLQFSGEEHLEVRITPDEYHLGLLAVGLPAEVVTEAFPDRPMNARISRIAPQVDSSRGTIEIRLSLEEELDDIELRPEMTATVEVVLGARDDALVLPAHLIRGLGTGQPWVLTVEEGVAARRSVVLGLQGTTAAEITSGVDTDDEILPPESKVTAGDPVRVRKPVMPAVEA